MIKARAVLALVAAASLSALSGIAFAAESASPAAVVAAAPQPGKMIFAANNQRLGAIYKVSGDAVQVIVEGKMVSLPTSSISLADNGKFVTSLTRAEVLRAR